MKDASSYLVSLRINAQRIQITTLGEGELAVRRLARTVAED